MADKHLGIRTSTFLEPKGSKKLGRIDNMLIYEFGYRFRTQLKEAKNESFGKFFF